MEISFLLAGIAVVALAGAVQGLTGFGSALIMVPVLSLFLTPKEVVPITVLLGTVINLSVLVQARRSFDWKVVLPLFVPAVLCIPLGALLLMFLPSSILRIAIGTVVLATSSGLLLGFSVELRNAKLASIPVGALSGLLQGSITMSGPPVILFFQNQGMAKDRFRANIVAYFLATNLITIIAFAAGGIMTPASATPALYFLPALAVGLVIGMVASGRVPEKPFRTLALWVVALAGISSLISGIMDI